MTIVITGGCGFVGSSIALALKISHPSYRIIAFDNLRRRGSELNLDRFVRHGIEFEHGDIRNVEDLNNIQLADVIIEASAEPSVLAGINSTPEYAVNTNLLGTINALNLAARTGAQFIFLSTSRVYPINHIERIKVKEEPTRFQIDETFSIPGLSKAGISEAFPLDGYRSIYGATKLASELMIQEYNEFYKLKTVINRCGVVTGPWQMGKVDQGFVVLWMAKHFWKQRLSYIGFGGKGKQVRDILHIEDLYRLVEHQIHDPEKFNGGTFNVGGGLKNAISLQELTSYCEEFTGNTIQINEINETRNADIQIYITDNNKIINLSGWKPEKTVRSILGDIYNWILINNKILENVLK